MASLRDYLKPNDQALFDNFIKDPVGHQKIRPLIEAKPNGRKESSTQVSKSKTQSYKKVIRVTMPVK